MTNNAQALRSAAAALVHAAEMLEHNDAIFNGKWKKGSKAWSGDFIERTVQDGLAQISAVRSETTTRNDVLEEAAQELDHRAFLCHAHDDFGRGRENGLIAAVGFVRALKNAAPQEGRDGDSPRAGERTDYPVDDRRATDPGSVSPVGAAPAVTETGAGK